MISQPPEGMRHYKIDPIHVSAHKRKRLLKQLKKADLEKKASLARKRREQKASRKRNRK